MTTRFGLLLDDVNARRVRRGGNVDVVLLERTLVDPPRMAAGRRWAQMLRRTFPRARFVPYAWHLVTHGPEDGLRERGSRSLPGAPGDFGRLADTPNNAEALSVVKQCIEVLESNAMAIRTPASLAPGAIGRARIGAFLAARAAEGIDVVWEPEGLWTPVEAMAMIAPHRSANVLITAFEAGRPRRSEADDAVLGVGGAWLRVDGAGPRRTIHGGHIDALAEHLEVCPDTTLVFTGPRADLNLTEAHKELAF